ncbi:LysR substrate-binding domain-containing protein [Donghicola sp. XS_ASV15]|uniref:LysR substrate-binding domain-containing protein n=1 Tax=Donghicola sp. XS_ASV15 TaxID=3241295 RepID=UPI00351183F1
MLLHRTGHSSIAQHPREIEVGNAQSEIEAAFVSEPFGPYELETLPVFTEQLALIAPQSLPAIQGPGALRGRTMIAFETGCSYRRIFESWFSTASVVPERVMELASYHAIFAYVVAGSGIGIMPRAVLTALRAEGQVQIWNLPTVTGIVRTHLVWRKAQASRPLDALRQMLIAVLPSGEK